MTLSPLAFSIYKPAHVFWTTAVQRQPLTTRFEEPRRGSAERDTPGGPVDDLRRGHTGVVSRDQPEGISRVEGRGIDPWFELNGVCGAGQRMVDRVRPVPELEYGCLHLDYGVATGSRTHGDLLDPRRFGSILGKLEGDLCPVPSVRGATVNRSQEREVAELTVGNFLG